MFQNIKAKSIGQIYSEISAKWFRVRDITTLRDYIVLEFTQMSVMSDPRYASVVCCEDQMYGTLDCTDRRFALLSSPDELVSYRRYKKSAMTTEIFQAYNLLKKDKNHT